MTPHFRWTVDEICRFLIAVPWGKWSRGEIGESLYMILKEDGDFQTKLEEAAIRLAQQGENDAAFAALFVATYEEAGDQIAYYQGLITREPRLDNLGIVPGVEELIEEHGGLCLFE